MKSWYLLPFALLVGFCCYTVFAVLTSGETVDGQYSSLAFSNSHYAGFVAVVLCAATLLWARQWFKYALGVTLLLGTCNILSFTLSTLTAGVGFNDVGVSIQPFSLGLLLLAFTPDRATAAAFIKRQLFPAPSPQQLAKHYRESIEQFKETFSRKSNESLQTMVQERKVVSPALAAAEELLSERGVQISNTPKN